MNFVVSILRNYKTSGISLAGIVVYLLGHFGVVIDETQANQIIMVLIMVLGFFTKDSDKEQERRP